MGDMNLGQLVLIFKKSHLHVSKFQCRQQVGSGSPKNLIFINKAGEI